MAVVPRGGVVVPRCKCAAEKDCGKGRSASVTFVGRGFLCWDSRLRGKLAVPASKREAKSGWFCVSGTRGNGSVPKMVNVEDKGVCCSGDRNPVNGAESSVVAGTGLESAEMSGDSNLIAGNNKPLMSTVGKSTNIVWQECSVGKSERQQFLNQKGCVIWITGLSGSGKSTLACSLSRELHDKGKLTYILDGDNVRHGLNKDLGFNAEDRAENIRRVGEVAKLFADAGIICIASLISPYRRDRDACRDLLPDSNFIEVYMNVPLEVCEARDSKGLYKLARAGKIKGFTGIDDPYEPPLNCEIMIELKNGTCPSPVIMAQQVSSYLEDRGFLYA